MPKSISDIDENMILYYTMSITGTETPGCNLEKFKIYKMVTDKVVKFPVENYLVSNKVVSLNNIGGVSIGSVAVVDKSGSVVIVDDKGGVNKIGLGVLVNPVDVKTYNGYYFVSDRGRGSVVVFNSSGVYISEIPVSIGIGRLEIKNGKLYVIDETDKSVKIYSGLLNLPYLEKEVLVNKFNYGKDISVDEVGNIYIADGDKLMIFNPKGNL